MRRQQILLNVSLIFAALSSAGLAMAQGEVGVARAAPQVSRAEAGQVLMASRAAPDALVAGYLRSRGRAEAAVASLRSASSAAGRGGATHLRMQQMAEGLTVHGAYVKATVNSRGELVHVIDHLAPVTPLAVSRIDAAAALRVALARLHPAQAAAARKTAAQGNTASFDAGTFFHTAPTVTAVAVPMQDGTLARGWLVETWSAKSNQLHETLVGGDGRILEIVSRTANDSYNIFPVDPGKGPQAVVAGPGAGNAQSPIGWLGGGSQSTIKISGNNTDTYLDANANNQPDKGGTAVAGGNFLTTANLTVAPGTSGNTAVAVQNLFYLNNVIHDILYRHGFDEAAGNFQADNFGKGGRGRDPVQAEAQDGSGTDNANFATPADGRKPRMQMYLWSGAGPTHEVLVNSPVSKSYGAKGAQFGPVLTTTGITGGVVLASPADGCTTVSTAVSGKVALIDRGTCAFTLKVVNAQAAGATSVVVANNTGTTEVFEMGGTDTTIRIPAVMIGKSDGAELRTLAAPNATVRKRAVQPLQIDASLDTDVVFHEYGHGLSWRMIGSMSGPLAGAVGEGNSDGIAMLVNGDDVIGEYSASGPLGIRRYRYANYPLTYADVNGAEVHNDGEIYAAIIWRLIELFGTRREALFGYVVDGMNYTPATPAFENMRDGILASVRTSQTPSDCSLVWQAFAQYGVGVGAQGAVLSSTSVQITPSFVAPASCN